MYAGSLFVGHYPAEELVNHFYKMTNQLEVNGRHLLYLGVDGPTVNVKFERDRNDGLKKKEGEHHHPEFRHLLSSFCIQKGPSRA